MGASICMFVWGSIWLCSIDSSHQNHTKPKLRSRGSTHRSRTNPLGRKDSPSCRLGNLLCCRALVLVILAAAKGVFYILEQPQSSCMEYHPLFQRMSAMLGVRRISIAMSDYGGPTPKRTLLYTSAFEDLKVNTILFLYRENGL